MFVDCSSLFRFVSSFIINYQPIMIESNSWLLSVIAVTLAVLGVVLYANRSRKKIAQPIVRSMRHSKCWCCYNRTIPSSLTPSIQHNKRTVSQELVKAFSCHSNSIESNCQNDDDDDDDDDDDSASLLTGGNYGREKQFLHTIDFNQNCHRNPRLIPIEHVKNVIFNQNNLNYSSDLHKNNDFQPINQGLNDFRSNNNIHNIQNNHNSHIIYENRHNTHCQAPMTYGHNYYNNYVPSDQSRCNSRFSSDTSRNRNYAYPTSQSVTQDLFEAKRRLFRRQTSLSTEDGSQESYSHSTDFNPVPPTSRRQSNGLKQRAILGSMSYKCNSRASYHSAALSNGLSAHSPELKTPSQTDLKPASIDLISLAEKGRIGKQTSLEENSSEAGSNVEPILTNAFRKKLTNRMLLRMRNNHVSSESSNSYKEDDKPRSKFERMRSFGSNDCESDSISSQFNEPKDIVPKESDLKLAKLSKSDKNSKMSFCGKLSVSFAYDAPSKKLYVGVLQLNGENSTGKNRLCDVSKLYVQLTLLPSKRHKHKTKPKPIFGTTFMESFVFNRISNTEISKAGIRFRVYCQSVFSKKVQLVGECELQFARTRPQQQETRAWLELEPPKIIKPQLSDERSEVSSLERTESSSSQSLNATLPEILLGLSYNATTGRLSVTIIKGSQLRTSNAGGSGSSKAIDTYVKVSLLSSNGQEIARSKTSVCRGQPNPYFKETFMFQVALFQLVDVTLMLLTYSRRNIKRKDLIGWLSFGCNSSGEEQAAHWKDMQDKKGEQVLRWHILQQS